MWHAQITSLTLRRLERPEDYDNFVPYTAVARVDFLARGEVFIHGFLRIDGLPLTVRDWRDIGRLLHDRYGVVEIRGERKGRPIRADVTGHPRLLRES